MLAVNFVQQDYICLSLRRTSKTLQLITVNCQSIVWVAKEGKIQNGERSGRRRHAEIALQVIDRSINGDKTCFTKSHQLSADQKLI